MLKKYLPKFKLVNEELYDFKFTIFVPVYNAAETINRVFDSIEKQTFNDFEVIVINDGSTDQSDEVISQRLTDLNFKCTYINNDENINKMGVFFQAIKLAKGEFFLTHDADDECLPESLETFNKRYKEIPDELKDKISGVTCRCKNQFGEAIGKSLPENPFFSNSFESSIMYGLSFEKWGFVKTRLLKSIEVDDYIFGKGLIPEGFIWLVFAKEGYTTKYCSDVIRIYHVDNLNSLSAIKYDKKALGMSLYGILFINYFFKDYFYKAPKQFVKRALSVLFSSKYQDFKLNDYLRAIDPWLMKLFIFIFWPVRKL